MPFAGTFPVAEPSPIVNNNLAEARAVFEKNIAAIKKRDKAAYLSVYLDSDRLARTSPDGPVLGFAEFSKQAGTKWPDTLEADPLDQVDEVLHHHLQWRVHISTAADIRAHVGDPKSSANF